MLKTRSKAILSAMLVLTIIVPTASISYGIDDCNTVMTTRIDQYYQGPVFVDAYWTESSSALTSTTDGMVERQVGPGEGKATLAVVLMNRNTIDISAATGYLQLPEGFKPTGTSVFAETGSIMSANGKKLGLHDPATASYNAIIPAKSSFTLYFDVDILDVAEVGTKITQLVVQYYRVSDPGLCTSALIKFPMVLAGKTILDVTVDDNYLVPNTPNTVNISITNKGTADATGTIAYIVSLGESGTRSQTNDDDSVVLTSSDTDLINLGENIFNVGTIPAGTAVRVSTVIFPSKDAASTVQNMDIQLIYANAYGDRQTITVGSGLVVLPNPVDASVGISYADAGDSHILTAEKLQDLSFIVTNNSPDTISEVVVSIVPQSTSVTVVGDSKWTIPVLESGESRKVAVKAIAAKSMISSPTSFTVNLDYIAKGEERTDSLNLGAFVAGNVKIHAYDLTVNYVGNMPNVVGNILNQGNTAALYTSVELLSVGNATLNGGRVVPSQYVGDVSADSSIPFSIPIADQKILKPGPNDVTLKITYADDLKNFHEETVSGQVNFEKKPDPSEADRRQGPDITQMVIPGVVVAAAVAVGIMVLKRKRRGSSDQSKFESDIESLLDEHEKEKQEK